MRRQGFDTRELDAYSSGVFDPALDLSDPDVIDREIADARAGLIDGAHVGLLCSSWCQMAQKFNGCTRTSQNPEGSGLLARELAGNLQLKQAVRLILVFLELGIPLTLENPYDSVVWKIDAMLQLRGDARVTETVFDQCMFKLRPPDFVVKDRIDVSVRKRTRLIGSLSHLCSLKRMCDGNHCHAEAWGTCRVNNKTVSRSRASGAYPPCLCHSLSKLFLQHPSGP